MQKTWYMYHPYYKWYSLCTGWGKIDLQLRVCKSLFYYYKKQTWTDFWWNTAESFTYMLGDIMTTVLYPIYKSQKSRLQKISDCFNRIYFGNDPVFLWATTLFIYFLNPFFPPANSYSQIPSSLVTHHLPRDYCHGLWLFYSNLISLPNQAIIHPAPE